MCKRTTFIAVTVVGVLALLAGLGVLIWWLVDGRYEFKTNVLEGDSFPNLEHSYQAGFTSIRGAGDMFWWFWPCTASSSVARPLLLWLDGVTGLPPSLHANFGMFGPLDLNLNKRNDSWIDEFNLLLVDAPLGTGFSATSRDSQLPRNLDESTDHLLYTLESFYSLHADYEDTPLYIFGQGQGAQSALALTVRMAQTEINFSHNLKGVVLGNGIVSPATALNRLAYYLKEMGYVDAPGRSVIEDFALQTSAMVSQGQVEEAFDKFLSLEQVVNEEAGAIAVNLGYVIEKLSRQSSQSKNALGYTQYLERLYRTDLDFNSFMESSVAPVLGISSGSYDQRREAALQASRGFLMTPLIKEVEYILSQTSMSVTIYNGNLDAVSNTPGQLDWVQKLTWSGQDAFLRSPRQTLVVDGLVQGYFQETDRLAFYWINAAGQSVPLDSPRAMRRVLQRITGSR